MERSFGPTRFVPVGGVNRSGGRLSEVEWSALVRMRDRITHQYWAVEAQIVWDTAVEEIAAVRAILAMALGLVA